MYSISSNLIIFFHWAAGDIVQEDDVIAQLETDKVVIDIKYQKKEPGQIAEILAKEGDTVNVGQEFAKIDDYAGEGTSFLRVK